MHLSDITKVIIPSVAATVLEGDLVKIKKECHQFLMESGGLPVYKELNRDENFIKVKARLRKHNNIFSETFNNAFEKETSLLRQRAIFTHGKQNQTSNSYFIFPTDGYGYVYNTQISDSSSLASMHESLRDSTIFTEILQHNYTNTNLMEGIQSGAEILFHGVPYCYAIHTGSVESYDELLSIVA